MNYVIDDFVKKEESSTSNCVVHDNVVHSASEVRRDHKQFFPKSFTMSLQLPQTMVKARLEL